MNSQLVIILIFAGISTLSWVFGKLREQAELKRARDDARKRRDEELRTGRSEQEPSPAAARPTAAQSRAQELAARRQAQLEQLRRQQQSRAQVTLPGGVVIVRTPQTPGPVSRGQSVPRRAPTPTQSPGIPVPPRKSTTRPTLPQSRIPSVQRPAQIAQPPAPAARPVAAAPKISTPIHDPAVDHDSPHSAVRALLRGAPGQPRSARDLRALFGVMEVLGPPVALRRTERLL